jgi:hypothetical protein
MAGAWNYGKGVSKYAHLYQRDVNVASGNTKVDRNVWLAPFPAWQGDDMPLNDADKAWIRQAIKDELTDKGKTDAGEARRMLGVILGWQSPSPGSREAEFLAKMQGTASPVDVDAIAKAVVDEDHRRSES